MGGLTLALALRAESRRWEGGGSGSGSKEGDTRTDMLQCPMQLQLPSKLHVSMYILNVAY